MNEDLRRSLEQRLGRVFARQRLGIETDHEARIFGFGFNLLHIDHWYSVHTVIRAALTLVGLYGRARRNAERVVLRRNEVASARLPRAFDGYTILHLSDLHTDISEGAMHRVVELLADLRYDIAVLTGDFRGRTFGTAAPALEGMAGVCATLTRPIFGVLGNHDTVEMVPALEAMGVRMLMNECETLGRGDERIHLAGIDDAHYFRVHNIEKAATPIPEGAFSILLSHTPEIYRQAAHAGFDLMLSGHTHGGQICLPGGIPVTLDAVLPRRMGAGAWRYREMQGYTSVGAGTSLVPVRLNCPPEITLHSLRRA